MSSPLIALAQIEALYFSKNYVESDSNMSTYDAFRYEFISENSGDSIVWNVSDMVEEYYPMSFNEMVDPDWGDEGEFIYSEVLKRIINHPDLERIEGMISPLHTRQYDSPEQAKKPLYVRFPVILRAEFDYDEYSGEADCWYEFRGVPDLDHLEDLPMKV